MSKKFEEYKKNKQITEAYEEACKVQESLALTVIRDGNGRCNKEYEGHIAVNDILNKIDAMVRMFEQSIKNNNFQESSYKITEIICNLYDLAQIKMIEAKKQAKAYMEKATGIRAPQEEIEDVPEREDLDDQPIDDKKVTFQTRGPLSSPEQEEELE